MGRTRLVRAGASAVVEPLTRLIELAFGPRQVVTEEFGGPFTQLGTLRRRRNEL